MAGWLQTGGAAAAEAVAQNDRLDVVPRIELLNLRLKRGAQMIRAVVQAHLEKAGFNEVSCARRMPGDFAFKDPAGQQGGPRRGDAEIAQGHDFWNPTAVSVKQRALSGGEWHVANGSMRKSAQAEAPIFSRSARVSRSLSR